MAEKRNLEKIIETPMSFLARTVLSDSKLLDECVADTEGSLLKNPQIIVFGKPASQHRSVGFFSNASRGYAYSGQLAKSQPLTPNLTRLLDEVNALFRSSFNGILVNRYENGSDYIGAHSDAGIVDPIGVVSVSWGEERKFRIREKRTKKIVADVRVESGQVLQMGGAFQREFTHEIPISKTKKPRVSLTFRTHKN